MTTRALKMIWLIKEKKKTANVKTQQATSSRTGDLSVSYATAHFMHNFTATASEAN